MKNILRISLLLIPLLATVGCGVSQEVYQAEFLKAQELEATKADLETQLQSERAKVKGSASALRVERGKTKKLTAELAAEEKRLEEMTNRLSDCQGERDELSLSLDVSRMTVKSQEKEVEKLLDTLEDEKGSCTEIVAEYKTQLAEQKERIETLRGRILAVEADRAVLIEQREKLEREKREKVEELSSTYEGLLTKMKDEIEKGQVTISRLKGKLSVNLLNEILFDSGSAEVKAQGKEVLEQVAIALEDVYDKAIVIEGHTDNVKIIGGLAKRFPTNWELSTARAVSVVRYLTEEVGVDPLRVSAAGYGEHRPVADNETEEGRALNRRIEIKLVPLDPEIVKLLTGEASEEEVLEEDGATAVEESSAEEVPIEESEESPAEMESGENPDEASPAEREEPPAGENAEEKTGEDG